MDDHVIKIFDPWSGESKITGASVLLTAVEQLRDYLKFCPLLITVK